jgi:AraC family transcriptional regulator, regulatory protein of adaptative response / methylated-DNA-[protein]-cysteine methyltransferase
MIINVTQINTPLGSMTGCATNQGVCLLEFGNQPNLEKQLGKLCSSLNATISSDNNNNTHLDQLKIEINEYFAGIRKQFNLPLVISGTQFQQSVWQILTKIPYGETWSYKEQATKLNKPKAVRAVGATNGQNLISIIIPCHRVIGSNGKLVGYAGGLSRKEWLLNFEKQQIQ